MGLFDKILSSEEEDISLEEIIMGLDSAPYEETTPSTGVSTSVIYIVAEDPGKDIYKVKEAIQSGDIVILNTDNLKTKLKQNEFLVSLGAALKELNAEIRRIRNYNIFIITPKNVHVFKR